MQQSYIPETEQQTMYNEFMQGTPVLPSAVPTKADTLAQRKQEKVDVLASKISSPLLTEGMPHLDSNEYEMDGYLERGGNKLFNTLSDHDMQAIAGMAIADYQLQRDADGSTFYMQDGEKVKYDGDAQFLYGYGNDEGIFKLGISRGDLPSADYRYQPGRAEQEGYSVGSKGYGWAPGPEGLDVENRQMEILLPAEIAERLEYMYHGREGSLDSRELRKPVEGGAEFDKQRAALGSGYTEYYTGKEGLFGDSRVGQQSDVNELYQQFLNMGQEDRPRILSKEEIGDLVREREAAQRGAVGTTIHEAQQVVSGVLSGIGKGAIDLADAGQELITWAPQELVRAVTGNDKFNIDLIPDEFKADLIAGMDNLTGYDRRADEITFQKMTDNLDKAGIKITSWDTFKEAWSDPAKKALVLDAAKEAGMNPSLVLSSIAEIIGSGASLGAVVKVGAKAGAKVAPKLAEKVGKITQTNNAVIGQRINQVKNSGLSKAEKLATIKELEKTYNLGKRLPDIMKGTVYSNADMMVRVNNDLTEFEKNNGGEPADFYKTLEIVAINRVLSAMEVGALRFEAKIGGIPKEILEGSIAKGLADAAGHIIKSGAVEGVQETIDGIAEQLTQKLGSKEYEDKTVRELMDDATGEILAGTMLGISGGTMVSAGAEALESNTLGDGVRQGAARVVESYDRYKEGKEEGVKYSKKVDKEAEELAGQVKSSVLPDVDKGSIEFLLAEVEKKADPELVKKVVAERKAKLENKESYFLGADKEGTEAARGLIESIQELAYLGESVDAESVVGKAVEGLGVNEAQFRAQVESAVKAGEALRSLRGTGVTGKVAEDVGFEVSEGPRGFVTQAQQALLASKIGDSRKVEQYTNELSAFLDLQVSKRETFVSAEREMAREITALVEMETNNSKDIKEIRAALKKIVDSERVKSITYGPSDTPFRMKYSTVAENILTGGKTAEQGRGLYKQINNVSKEVELMEAAAEGLSNLLGFEMEMSVPAGRVEEYSDVLSRMEAESVPDDVVRSIDTSMGREGVNVENVKKSIDRSKRLDTEQKEAAKRYVDRKLSASEAIDIVSGIDSLVSKGESKEDVISKVIGKGVSKARAEELYRAATKEEVDVKGTKEARKNVRSEIERINDELKTLSKFVAENKKMIKAAKKKGESVQALKKDLEELYREAEVLKTEKEGKVKGLKESKLGKELEDRFKGVEGNVDLVTTNGQRRRLRDLFKVTKATGANTLEIKEIGLSKENEKWVKRFIDGLPKVLGMPKMAGDVVKFNDAEGDLGRLLVLNKDGSINEQVAVGMVTAMVDFLGANGREILGAKDEADVREMFGIPEESAVMPSVLAKLANGGMRASLAANSVGAKVIQELGIKSNEATTATMAELRTSLGAITLLGMQELGLIGNMMDESNYVTGVELQDPTSTAINNLVKGTPELSVSMGAIRDLGLELSEGLALEVSPVSTYSFEKPRKGTVKIRRQEFLEVNEKHKEAIQKLEGTAYGVNSGLSVLKELFSSVEGIKVHLKGDRNKDLTKDTVVSMNSSDAKVDTVVDSLMAMEKELEDRIVLGESSDVYFNWFVAKNQRLHLESATVNPQDDKNLARWLVTPKDSVVSMDKGVVQDWLAGKSEDKKAALFVYGLVQAFDGGLDGNLKVSIDKGVSKGSKETSNEAIARVGKALLEMEESKLFEMAKKADHLGHAALAIANIRKFKESETEFESDMVAEFDGKTNGFAFRTLQFTTENLMGWLPKVGVFLEDTKLDNVNDSNRAGIDDAYMEGGKRTAAIIKPLTTKDDKFLRDMEGFLVKNGMVQDIALMGKEKNAFDELSDKAKKFIRDMFKNPIMVFNYGAGIKSIKKAVVKAKIEESIDKMYAMAKSGDEGLKAALRSRRGAYEGLQKLGEMSIYSSDSDVTAARNALMEYFGKRLANPIGAMLSETFKDQVEVNGVVNNAMGVLHQAFSMSLNGAKVLNGGMNEAQINDWMRENVDMVPGFMSANGEGVEQKLAVLRTGYENLGQYVSTRTKLSIVRDGETYKNNELRLYPTERVFVEPGVATLPVAVQSMDASTLVRTILKSNGGILALHDAITVGAGQVDSMLDYNEVFYKLNAEYSIIEEVYKALKRLGSEELSDKYGYDLDLLSVEIPVGNGEVKVLGYQDVLVELGDKLGEISSMREKLFSGDAKVGQMAGVNGTMANMKGRKVSAVKIPEGEAEVVTKVDERVPEVLNEVSVAAVSTELEMNKPYCKG